MELLIRVKDNPSPDRRTHTARFHRGDVIAVMPDDHVWSTAERVNPNWRIISIDITQAEADSLLSQEIDSLGVKDFVWKRQRMLDIGNFPARVRNLMTALEVIDQDRYRINFSVSERNSFRSSEIVKGVAANGN